MIKFCCTADREQKDHTIRSKRWTGFKKDKTPFFPPWIYVFSLVLGSIITTEICRHHPLPPPSNSPNPNLLRMVMFIFVRSNPWRWRSLVCRVKQGSWGFILPTFAESGRSLIYPFWSLPLNKLWGWNKYPPAPLHVASRRFSSPSRGTRICFIAWHMRVNISS